MCLFLTIHNFAVPSRKETLLALEGERVDLLTFPPACLPSHGQSFAGEPEGRVAGEFSSCPTNENQCFKVVPQLKTNVSKNGG